MDTVQEPGGRGDLVERLCQATNAHDLQGIGACFAIDYRLEMPTHPEGDFVGREQVLRNWGQIFAGVPDVAVEARSATQGDTAWSEWEMRGTRGDGSPYLRRGVITFRMRDREFSAARFHVEHVEPDGIGIDEVTRQTFQVGAAPIVSMPTATPPSAVSNWTDR